MSSDTDTRYFDSEFTGESVELTPPDMSSHHLNSIAEEMEQSQPYFPQFSYQDLAGSISISASSCFSHT